MQADTNGDTSRPTLRIGERLISGVGTWEEEIAKAILPIDICSHRRFYADYNVPPYPVEVSIRWPKTLLTKEQGEQIRSAFSGDEVGTFGAECYTRIGTWTFSAAGDGEKTVTVEQIKAKVAAILNKQDMVFK